MIRIASIVSILQRRVDASPDMSCVAYRAKQEYPADLSAVALRAKEEEAEGKIRWLRPEFQDPDYQASGDRAQVSGEQPELAGTEIQPTTDKPITEQLAWPKELRAQVALIRRLSAQTATPTVETITPLLKGRNTAKRKEQIAAILGTLENLGWG